VEFIVESVLLCEEEIGDECQIELAIGEWQSRQLSRYVMLRMGLEIREKKADARSRNARM